MQTYGKPAILPHARYWDSTSFRMEMDIFDSATWHLVGLTRDFAKDNDYITTTIGSKSVVIQNFKGILRAFDNVCAHRFCRIRSENRGNGPLRCPYHSWTYNMEGRPIAIPHASEAFGFADGQHGDLCLKRWQIEHCGQFVFVRGNAAGQGLEATLGSKTFSELEVLSNSMGLEIDTFVSEYGANWKICVENTLDEYHAQFVHPTTFRPMLAGRFLYTYDGDQSKMEAEITERNITKWRRVSHHFNSRAIKSDTYYHYLIFPLVTVASTFGASFSVQTFRPVAPDKTLLTSRLFIAGIPGNDNKGFEEAIANSAKDFNRTVFLEDKFVCEQVQLGIQQKDAPAGLIGKFEQRILHFQRTARRVFSY